MTTIVSTPVLTAATGNNATAISGLGLMNLLMAERGATFISFVAQTEPKMTRTGNPFVSGKGKSAIVDVVKTAKISAMLNFQYESGVIRRLEKEGKNPEDFKRGESWHTPVIRPDGTLTPFCQHNTKGTYYLRCQVLKVIDTEYTRLDGTPIAKADIDPFLIKSDYASQGLDDPLIFATYGLDGIRAMTMNGITYLVK